MNRRETLEFLLGAAALASPAGIGGGGAALAQQKTGPFTLPTLGYSYEALEPNIDATTMRIHHAQSPRRLRQQPQWPCREVAGSGDEADRGDPVQSLHRP